jgi:hypothetical protein
MRCFYKIGEGSAVIAATRALWLTLLIPSLEFSGGSSESDQTGD